MKHHQSIERNNHARSVCSSWRSTFPLPCSLSSPSYSLPRFHAISLENEGFFTLEKIPLFLLRAPTLDASASEYFLGGIGRRDESEDQTELPSPEIQCSVKVKIRRSANRMINKKMNMLDCEILPLGQYKYRIIGWEPMLYKGVAFLPLNKEVGREFVVLLHYHHVLLVLTSAEMKWKRLENVPKNSCKAVVTFRGKFYAYFFTGTVVSIDPYSLDVTLLMPSSLHQGLYHYLVTSGNDELFLVELIFPPGELELDLSDQLECRVSRLDEEAGKWVEVNDLGDRLLFIHHGHLGNFCCSAKELPHGCGLSGISILIGYDKYARKYEHSRWRFSRVV